jgi:hypothetical protein
MAKIVTHNPQTFESFSFETLTQCISTIHSALQTSAVNAVNRNLGQNVRIVEKKWIMDCFKVGNTTNYG